MSTSLARELADLLPDVLSALAAHDPKLALQAALELLTCHGFVQEPGEGLAGFELEHRGRKLSFFATQPGFERGSLEPALRSALQLGFMRAVEHEEREELAERYQMLSTASFEGIMINADQGEVIEVNQRLAELVGYEPSEMLGRQTLLRCVAAESRVPIVLSSGYLEASSERELDPSSFQAFLRKPYRTEDLMLAIEQARAQSSCSDSSPLNTNAGSPRSARVE